MEIRERPDVWYLLITGVVPTDQLFMFNPNVIVHVPNWKVLQPFVLFQHWANIERARWFIPGLVGPFQHFLFSSGPLSEGNTKKGKKPLCLPMRGVSSDMVPMPLITSPCFQIQNKAVLQQLGEGKKIESTHFRPNLHGKWFWISYYQTIQNLVVLYHK